MRRYGVVLMNFEHLLIGGLPDFKKSKPIQIIGKHHFDNMWAMCQQKAAIDGGLA